MPATRSVPRAAAEIFVHRMLGLGALGMMGALLGASALIPREPRADFRLANNEECRTLDPHLMQLTNEIRVGLALFEGLTSPDPLTTEPRPGAAASWGISPDGRTYRFFLDPAARWSNSAPLRAEHFVAAWERALNPRIAANNSSALFVIRGARERYDSIAAHDRDPGTPILPFATVGVRADDERTLVVELAQPCPYFLDVVGSMPIFWPVYPPALEGVAYDWPADWQSAPVAGHEHAATRHLWTRPARFVGNGPYVPQDWAFKHRLRLRRNEHYRLAAQVEIATIDVLPIADRNTRFMCYETGAVELALDPSVEISRVLYSEMCEGRRHDYRYSENLGTYFFRINTRRPPLDEPGVRRALGRAIDRDAICRNVWGFGQRPAATLVPPGNFDVEYTSPAGLPFDPAVARDELRRAGWTLADDGGAPVRDGTPFPVLELLYNTDSLHNAIAQTVAHDWRRHLGIRVELRNVESRTLAERVRRLDYDIARGSWYADYLDPLTFLEIFTADNGNNQTGWGNRHYDTLLGAARLSRVQHHRSILLAEAERFLVEDQAPLLCVNHYVGAHLLDPRFDGVPANARQLILLGRLRRAPQGGR